MPICISKPSLVRALGHGHHAGVVDQDVDRLVPAVGERAHGGEVGEVQLARPRRRRPASAAISLAALGVAHGQHDARARAGELGRGGAADAAVRAGDDHGAAVEVRKVLGSPLARAHGVQCSRGYKDVNDNNAVTVNSRLYASRRDRTARPYHHGNLRPALLDAAERALAARRRAVAARARARDRRQPRARRAATSPTSRRCSTRSRWTASSGSGASWPPRCEHAGPDFARAACARSPAPTSASPPSTRRCWS